MQEETRNIVICGHSKHGKSTFIGRLLVSTGVVSEATVEKVWRDFIQRPEYQADQKDYNRYQAFMLSRRRPTFGSDRLPDDQSRSVFPVRAAIGPYTLIDNPGHYERFLDNIVYGIYLADYAILVVDANAGVEEGTELVARILEGLKVPLLGICVTKMDRVGYTEAKYDEVKNQIEEKILDPYFHRRRRIPIVPVSAITGAGFHSPRPANDRLSWYHDRSVAELLTHADTLDHEHRESSLRITVEGPGEFYTPPGVGAVVIGSVESGTVRIGDTLMFTPNASVEPRTVRVRSIRRVRSDIQGANDSATEIHARALVALGLSASGSTDALKRNLRRGTVFTREGETATVAIAIRARLIFFVREAVYSNKEFQLHVHGQLVPCTIADVDSRSDLGESSQTFSGLDIRARLNLKIPVCIEPVTRLPRLGRFVLRSQDRIVACGSCLETSSTHYSLALPKPGAEVDARPALNG